MIPSKYYYMISGAFIHIATLGAVAHILPLLVIGWLAALYAYVAGGWRRAAEDEALKTGTEGNKNG